MRLLFSLFPLLRLVLSASPASLSLSSLLIEGPSTQIRALSSFLSRHPHALHLHETKHHRQSRVRDWKKEESVVLVDEDATLPLPVHFQRSTPLSVDAPTRHEQIRRRLPKKRRSISNAVVESAHCEHVDLVDCSEYTSDEMSCMLTATGMTCCVCTAAMAGHARQWKLFA